MEFRAAKNLPFLWAFIALALSSYYFTGYYASDDMSYFGSARAIAEQGNFSTGFGGNRLGITLPLALGYYVTHDVSISLLPFLLLHPILVFITYAIARNTHNQTVANLAAALASVFPLAYVYTGAALPDMMLTVWLGLASLFLIRLTVAEEDHATENRIFLQSLLAGIFTGCGYLTKEYAVLLVVPALVILATRAGFRLNRQAILLCLAYILGLTAVIAAEQLLYFLHTGGWLARLSVTSHGDNREVLQTLMNTYGIDPWTRLKSLYAVLLPSLGNWQFGILACIAIYPLIYRIRWPGQSRQSASYIIFLWLGVYIIFGSSSLSEYIPPAVVDRYYLILAPTGITIVAGVLWRTYSLLKVDRPVVHRFAFIAIVCVFGVERLNATAHYAGNIYRAPEVKSFREAYQSAKERYPGVPIVVSNYYSGRMLPLFSGAVPAGTVLSRYSDSQKKIANMIKNREPFIFISNKLRTKDDKVMRAILALPQDSRYKIVRSDFLPPKSRYEELKYFVFHVLGGNATPRHIERQTNPWRTTELYTLQAAEASPQIDGNWYSLSSNYLVDGSELRWTAGNRGKRGYVQSFDSNSYKAAPLEQEGILPTSTNNVSVRMNLHGRGHAASVIAHLYGYRRGALVNHSTATVDVKADETHAVELNAASDKGIDNFKVRLGITPLTDLEGSVGMGALNFDYKNSPK